MDLKTQLANLIKLQAIDTQIYKLKNEKAALPQEIKLLESAFEEKKQSLENLEKVSLDLQKQKKDKELELKSKEDGIIKLQGQLYQLKTNKEYSAMLQQISDTKADASVIEDNILRLFDQIDKAKIDIENEKGRLRTEESRVNGEKKKIDDRIKEIDTRIAELEADRKQIIPGIDQKLFLDYERILLNRDGLAIVTVRNNSCQGCNMFVSAQTINLIKMYEHIITCETCNRMLYIDEDIV